MTEGNLDLLYCGEHEQEIRTMVIEDFPDAKIEDASDSVHRGRFSVEFEITDDEWMLWLMRKGVHEMSLQWQVMSMEDPDRLRPLVQQVIAEQKEGEKADG